MARDPALLEAVRDRFNAVASGDSGTRVAPCCGVALAGEHPPLGADEGVRRAAALAPGAGTAAAAVGLTEGQSVVDLGCGAGVEALIAGRLVGPRGRVWGIDIAEGMLRLARRHAVLAEHANVAFVHCRVEEMPIATATIDAAISNCVLSLCPDPGSALEEVARVLKPGGSLLLVEPLAAAAGARSPDAYAPDWTTCIPGALTAEQLLDALRGAGFEDVQIERRADAHGHFAAAALVRARRADA